MLNGMHLPLVPFFQYLGYPTHEYLSNYKGLTKNEEKSLLWDRNIFPQKRMYKHTKKMWDFYESYPVIFHFFPATSFLEQNPRKPKKTICAVSKNFAKLNYIIHPADLMSSWMQFANLHFGHKEIMYLLYIKTNTCYNTIYCNCSRMSLYIGIVYILKHEMAIYHICFRIFDREHSDTESSSRIIINVEFLSNYIKILNFSLNMINQLSKHPGKPIYLL